MISMNTSSKPQEQGTTWEKESGYASPLPKRALKNSDFIKLDYYQTGKVVRVVSQDEKSK